MRANIYGQNLVSNKKESRHSFIEMIHFLVSINDSLNYNQKQTNMNSTLSPGKMRLMKVLHIIMLCLSVLGSISLFIIPSVTTKVIIVFILLGYTFTFLSKYSNIRNLLKISLSSNEKNFQTIHKWDTQGVDNSKRKKQKSNLNDNTHLGSRNSKKETDFNTSLDRSLEKSAEVKNISMSIQRSMNSNSLNEKKITPMIQKVKKQFEGSDLMQIFTEDKVLKKESTLRKTRGSGIVLVDNQTYLSHNSGKSLQNANKEYQRFLKNVLKKQRKSIENKYKPLSQTLKKTVKMLTANINSIKDKLNKIAEEYFEIKLHESKKTLSEQLSVISLRNNQQKKAPFYLFLYKMLQLSKIKDSEQGYKLKKGNNWGEVQFKMKQFISSLQKISQTLGIQSRLLRSSYREDIEQFVEQYKTYVQYAQIFLQNEYSSNYNSKIKDVSFYTQLAKSRAFALHLVIKEMNASLKYARKIKFNDYLNFGYPREQNIQFQINKKEGSEGPYIHYDLKILDEGRQKMRYICQPGERNCLSVLYFLLLQLGKKDQMLSWNMYVKGLTQLIL